ncbi:MAG: DUF6807 domain-containing protein, partial [Planctomycetota bacterium]
MKNGNLIVLPALVLVTIVAFGCNAQATEITINAGKYDRPPGPVFFASQILDTQKNYNLVDADGKTIPIQADRMGRWWFWNPKIKAGQSVSFKVVPDEKHFNAVKLTKVKDGLIKVTIDGELFTAFNFSTEDQKPFLYPVIGPTGVGVTRDYPMKEVSYEERKRRDHPHHQSIWTAWGDVRTKDFAKAGTNYWHRPSKKKKNHNTGYQKLKQIVYVTGGPVFGQLQAEIEWYANDRRREFAEIRTYTFFRAHQTCRIIDQKNVFKFNDGEVMFADTKEGGIACLRIAVSMDEIGGGKMFNSRGGVGAKQCWGKAAEWCDYVGPVQDQTVGIAVMDAKSNYGHPTRWHIRDYGLYTANPFGLSYFVGKQQNGSKTWKKGESAEFNYRIFIHQGDTKTSRVADQYRNYTEPMKIN